MSDGAEALAALRAGGKAALARALARLEVRPDDPSVIDLLDAAWAAPIGHAIGLTGPPGVGKSTLTDALIRAFRAEGLRVGVLAVDPSSRRTGGALLGDRTRLSVDPEDAGVFVRSLAARDRLGGLAAIVWPALTLMRALYERVVIETVGVGQSETEIADVADTVVFCAQPGAGDSLQYMKAGVVEIPHLAVVTKADMGAAARRAVADLRGALSLAAGDAPPPAVLACSATTGEGIDALAAALDARARDAEGALGPARALQSRAWARRELLAAFGAEGLSRLAGDLDAAATDRSPFAALAAARERGMRAMTAGFTPH